MDYSVYIYAEKVYHRDIRDYWMNKKRCENPPVAEDCLPTQFNEDLLTRKPTLRLDESAAICDPFETFTVSFDSDTNLTHSGNPAFRNPVWRRVISEGSRYRRMLV